MSGRVKGFPRPAPENEGAGFHVTGRGRGWITAKGGNRERGTRRSEVYGDLSGSPGAVAGGKEPRVGCCTEWMAGSGAGRALRNGRITADRSWGRIESM